MYTRIQRRSIALMSVLTLILSMVSGMVTTKAYAATLPNGTQNFTGYIVEGSLRKSPDGFFTISASRPGLFADDLGAFIEDSVTTGSETVYFEVKAVGTLGSFEIEKLYMGTEYGAGSFSNVTVKGYANGIEQFSTDPFSIRAQDGKVANFPINYSAASGKSIDSFRVYYTREAGTPHISFNLTTFTIKNSSVNPPASSASSEKAMTGFSFNSLTPAVTGTVNETAKTVTVTVPYGTNVASLVPTITHTGASVSPNSGAAQDFTNPVTYTVTAADSTTQQYTVTVNEAAPSSNGHLSSLNVNGTQVSGFEKTDYTYSMEVPNGTDSIDIDWVLDEPGTQTLQAVKIDGVDQTVGPITDLSLTPGVARVIEIGVKAQNGTITTYMLSVTEKRSDNANLSNLQVTPGGLTFNPATLNYTVEVPYGTATVTVTPTLQDATATMTVNGASRASGQATSVTLDADGSTDITIVVTAQDGSTWKTYRIIVNEAAPSGNGYLSTLSVDGTQVSGFVKTTFDYSMEVPYGTGSIDVSWVLDQPGTQTLHSVKIDGVGQPLGPITDLTLTPGVARVIEIEVKAQNGTITTYTLTVTEKRSDNANLSNLQVTPGGLTFNPATLNYTVEVPYGTATVTVTPTLQDGAATMTVNGASRASGQATSVTLDADGSTDFPIFITAQDGVTTKTYIITVNVAAPSSNGYLSSLRVDGTEVSGFAKTDYTYSMEVPNGTGSIDVDWVLDQPGTQTLHSVKIDGVGQPLGPITDLSLTPGVARVIEIEVKAQNGTITTYTLSVTEEIAFVNKADLQAKVTDINNENLVEADYTPASWDALQDALTAAHTVLNNPNATQTQVDDALAALNAARNGLQNAATPVDKTALQAKVIAVTAENLDPAAYTSTSWQAFQTALTDANAVLANANATQADVNNALTALTNARQGLTLVSIPVVVDKSVLQLNLDKINAENLVEAKYTPESWRSLQNALTQANRVMTDPLATQVEVNAAVSALKAARNGLVERSVEAEKDALQAKVEEIDSENLLEEDYTKASWDKLQEALREANDVLADSDATQDEVNAALAALQKAREGLKKQDDSAVDKSKLDEKVEEIDDEDLDEDDYTRSSWRALEKALREANEVLADPDATQEEVDEALAELKKARKALEKAERKRERDKDRDTDRNPNSNQNSNTSTGNVPEPIPSTPESGEEKNDRKGYMNGYPSGKFDPDRMVTRAEIAMILISTGMVKQATSANGDFFDVADNYWAADAIKRANEAGLMNGYANGMFHPSGGITRAEMAAIIFKYQGLNGGGMSNSFSDIAADHWSTQMIAAVSEAGLMSGYPDGTFRPDQTLTRAEMVTILNRLLSGDQLNHAGEQTWPDVPPTHWAFKDIEAASKK